MGLGNQSYLGRFRFLQHLRLQRTIELPAQSPSTEGRLLCFLFKNASALKTLWFAVWPLSVEVHPSVAMSLANANLLEVLTVEFHHRYQIDTLLSSIPTGRLITLHLKDRNLMPTAEEELDLITVLASQQPTETLETLHLSCRFTLPAISSNPIRYPQVTKLSLERRSNDSDDWTTGQLMQLFPNVQQLSFTCHTTASLPSAAQTEQRTRNLASQASSSSRWERLDILVGSIGGLHSLGLQCTVQKAIMSFCGVADALLVLATLASLQPAKLTLIFNPRLSGDLTLHDCVVIVPFFFVNVSRKTNSLHIELHIKDNVSGLHELLDMIINYLGIFGVLENIVIMISVSALARRSATLVSEGEPDLIVDHLNTGIHWPPAPYQICPEVIARRCAVSAPTLREFSIYIALPYGADGPASASWGWQVEQGEHGVKMTPGFGKFFDEYTADVQSLSPFSVQTMRICR